MMPLDSTAWPALLALFDDRHYRRQTGARAGGTMADLRDFLQAGLAGGLSPSPLLDPAVYLERLAEAGLPPPPPDQPALADWLSRGLPAGILPTRLFDAAFYEATYPDLVEGRFAFEHFLSEGLAAGLRPNAWFDADWYGAATSGIPPGQPALLHFVEQGAQAGAAPNPLASRVGLAGVGLASWCRHGAGVMARLEQLAAVLNAASLTMLMAIYRPDAYARLAGLEADDALERLHHFLTAGLDGDLAPSPLFEPAYYARTWRAASGSELPPGMPALVHWLRHGRALVPVPTRLFSDGHYRRTYTDMADAGIDTYAHYVRHGVYEGREPNPWFDAAWYRHRAPRQDASPEPPYVRFLLDGHLAKRASRLLWQVAGGGAEAAGRLPAAALHDAIEGYARLVAATEPWAAVLSAGQLALAALLFVPEAYAAEEADGPGATVPGRLAHFLTHALGGLDTVGPLFSAPHYRLAAAAADLAMEEPPMVHFLRHGVERRIVPTPLFDEAYYLAQSPDLETYPGWVFLHFLEHGLYEGRDYVDSPMIAIAADAQATTAAAVRGRLALRMGSAAEAACALNPDLQAIARAQRRVTQLFASATFGEIMARAQQIEPLVGERLARRETLVAPWHDEMLGKLTVLRRRLPLARYDHVICVPWMRAGGADLVSGWVTHALRSLYPDQSVLMIHTDQPHFERADWLAPGIDVLKMSDVTQASTTEQAERLLFTLLRGLAPRTVFNINSKLCWEVLRRYGERMAPAKLFAYLFCWDQTESGLRVGYPSDFYQDTQASLCALLTDTRYLKDELVRLYGLPGELGDRIVPLNTPARAVGSGRTMAERGARSAGRRQRPLILWAGRLDYQKRFDLVIGIAAAMPDCDFHCWGGAMLDMPPDLSDMPANITMMGRFKSLTDLPLAECDGWLFTSAWEGMPTTLIELGAMGMPIVASAVGGVPELIDGATGWPVTPFDDVSGYVGSLREMADNPAERRARGAALQARVQRDYTFDGYRAALGALVQAGEA